MTGFTLLLRNSALNRLVPGPNLLFALVTLSIWVVWADAAYADGGDVCDYDEWYMHLECWFWNSNSGFVGAFTWLGSAAWGVFSGTFSGLFSSKPSRRRHRRLPPAGRGWSGAIETLMKINKADRGEYHRKIRKIRAAEPIWRTIIGLGTGALTYVGLNFMAALLGATTGGPLILGTSVIAGALSLFAPDVFGLLIKWFTGKG